jgi:rhodanese-related sulfurtransferase
MKKTLAALLSAAFLLTGCSSSTSATNLDAAGFAEQVTKADVITLDVRTPGEFMEGHIAGAINIDVEGSSFDSEIANLDKSKSYAVYCRSGRRSLVAVDKLSAAGFENLSNLNTGINDWIANGLPLVTS